MRLIIAGSRFYTPTFDEITQAVESQGWEPTTVLSGMCRGVDRQGGLWGMERGLPVECHTPNWERDGKRAGPIRNARMAENADALLAFWDGESRGTRDMLARARKRELLVHVVAIKTAWCVC